MSKKKIDFRMFSGKRYKWHAHVPTKDEATREIKHLNGVGFNGRRVLLSKAEQDKLGYNKYLIYRSITCRRGFKKSGNRCIRT